MTRSIECGDCGATVAYGRLSCPACGALLASVTGAQGARSAADVDAGAAAITADTPTDAAAAATAPDRGASEPLPSTGTRWPSPVGSTADLGPYPELEPDDPDEPGPEPVLVARTYSRPDPREVDRDALAPPPGAYRPPTFAYSAAAARVPEWPAPIGVRGTAGGRGDRPMDDHRSADSMLGSITLEPARLLDIAGWFVVTGSAMAILGLLLPWSIVVIGSRGTGGYFDDWGLAAPGHLVVLAGLLVSLGLGVVQTPVPAWLRTGVLGLGLGALLLGLIWPYAIGPLGADVGALMTALGGVALLIGGVVAAWASRHVEADPPV